MYWRRQGRLKLTGIFALSLFLAGQLTLPTLAHAPHKKDENNFTPCMSWLAQKPSAILLCIHGLGLDSTSYGAFASVMNQKNISCYALDVRGFGSWTRAQGHEQVDFDCCLEDIKVALTSIRKANPNVPIFLVGESMGGAIALRSASLYPELMDGVISSVPAAERFRQKRTDLKVALEFLKGPNKKFDIGDQIADQATKNENVRTTWECDPLSRFNLSAHELLQFQRFMNENHDAAKKINLPVLMLQGTQDKLVKPEGSFDLFERLASKEKIFIALPSEHLILEQQGERAAKFSEAVTGLVQSWITLRISIIQDKTMAETAKTADAVKIAEVAAEKIATEENAASNKDSVKKKDIGDEIVAKIEKAVADDSLASLEDAEMKASADANPMEREMALALLSLRQGRLPEAQKLLEGIVQTEPFNGDAHYWLALCLSKEGKLNEARKEKNLAQSLIKISGRAKQKKNYVLSSSENGEAETAGPASPIKPGELTGGKPTVLVFTAPWCLECAGIETLVKQAKVTLGEKFNVNGLNVDDKTNAALVKYFNIGPIPSFVFLRDDGTVSATIIGRATMQSISREVKNLASTEKSNAQAPTGNSQVQD